MTNVNFSGAQFGADAQPYVLPPYQYRNNEMFTLKVETDRDCLEAMVPEPLTVNADNMMAIYVGMLHVTEPTQISYGEAGIMVPVTLGDRAGTFMPILYLDEVELLTAGREFWGFPKVRGDIFIQRDEHGVVARVSEGGTDIINMKMNFERKGEPIPVYDREHFLLKSIPSVDGDGYDIRQINTCKVRDDKRKEILEGKASLALSSTMRNPLGELPIRNVVSSVYTVGDILLDRGEVIHDYLAESS